MKNPRAERTELEDMVMRFPYGTAFLAPTIARDGTHWSFLVHEKREVIKSVEGMADGAAADVGYPEVRCMLVTMSSQGAGIAILGLLLRFNSRPPVAYSLFMNPADPHTRELLDDMMMQEELAVDFFDEKHVARIVGGSALGQRIRETMGSLSDMTPSREVAFDLALEDLLSEHADSLSLWELLDACRPEDGGE